MLLIPLDLINGIEYLESLVYNATTGMKCSRAWRRNVEKKYTTKLILKDSRLMVPMRYASQTIALWHPGWFVNIQIRILNV